jgi:multisubunit Na+/H+ antiporter MnhG subunit
MMKGFIFVAGFYAAFAGLAVALEKTGIVSDGLMVAFFMFAIGLPVVAVIIGKAKKRRNEAKIRAAKNQLVEQWADRDIAE